ncbi:MAG TPA: enoyl-CoA hydratase [Candidatus Corynebacterium gallistercoris]|uniref:Enoyl-CoA hydratase n=1 Tax=Candidatus Corynebacterium gallistercoris TaxID=2838530 RepID=A0A9D1RWU0_9CORY|nr:enoyl-CoA hydratase [Candidatus Corynebacterium gallistercoris]
MSAKYSHVAVGAHGKVGVITLNRPEKRNAITAALATEVACGVREHVDAGRRVILLRGEGPAFSAGADLSGGVYSPDFFGALQSMLQAVLDAPVPVIADIHGPAVGAGCQLALACDLRVFGPKGAVWVPAAAHGFALDTWTHLRLKDLLGGAWARNIMVGGAKVGAEQAAAVGFASFVGDGTTDSLAYAQTIAEQAPLSMEHSKRVLNSPNPASDPVLDELMSQAWASADAAEARAARLQGRAPAFTGK